MAKLGIVSAEQFNKELENCASDSPGSSALKPFNASVIEKVDRGRGVGNNAVPTGLQKIIGETSVIEGRQAALELANDFGISPSSVSAYAKGATSTASYNKPEQTLTNYLAARKNKITKRALRALTNSLDQITPEKLQDVKVRDVAAIAKDMSVIAKNMEPEKTGSADSNAPKFVVYAPTIRDERSYETIVVNDTY